MLELLWLLLMTILAWARPRQDLVLENVLRRHQLAVLTRPTRTRPRARLCAWDELRWVLARRCCAGWRWTSRSRSGRPPLSPAVRDLIATMSRENRVWGTERIRGELLTLGRVVSHRSIQRDRWRGPRGLPSQTWRPFLGHHAHELWAADRCTVPTVTFKTLDVLVFSAYGRRERVQVNVTATPTAAWVWRQLLATAWGYKPRQLRRERDAVSGRDCRARARRSGIDAIATPVRSPRAHVVDERVKGTRRRACLDHLIGLDEPQLSSVLSEVVSQTPRPALVD